MYVAGGRTLEDALIPEIDRYNPVTGVWESNVFTWPNATSDGGAFAVDDLLYFVGGYDAAYNTLATLTALNTTSGEWIVDLPSMQLGRGDIAVTAFEGILIDHLVNFDLELHLIHLLKATTFTSSVDGMLKRLTGFVLLLKVF